MAFGSIRELKVFQIDSKYDFISILIFALEVPFKKKSNGCVWYFARACLKRIIHTLSETCHILLTPIVCDKLITCYLDNKRMSTCIHIHINKSWVKTCISSI